MRFPSSIQNLVNHFKDLPTVGPKTAERYVFYLLKKRPEELAAFARAIADLKEKTTVCQQCLAISESSPCEICANSARDAATLCIVADTRDMLAVESTKLYNGRYFCLGGLLNAIEGVRPEQLNIKALLEKLGGVKEVILALDANLEGETTAMYLAKLLKTKGLRVTRLARGLPVGADLEYADEITLGNALKYRNEAN
jgi:recombination protein RecR